jgi:hypothetical protein
LFASRCLVSTGATVTLVSIKLFESKASPVMTEMKREIITASGSKLTVLGKTIIDIDINGYVCSNVAIVADINVDGLLIDRALFFFKKSRFFNFPLYNILSY